MLKAATKAAQGAAVKLVKATVNGNVVRVAKGATVLEACKAASVRVPTLCYHPKFKAEALCRMCLVETKNKLVPACYTRVEDGMVINTDSEQIQEYRKRDLQFFLSRHPNDCMRCEASGNCKLQNLVQEKQVVELWPKSPRGDPLVHPEHLLHDHTSPAIYRDLDKCIECGLCVQACNDQKMNVLGFAERGKSRVPVTAFDKPLGESGCISCGQCTLRCPVGALIERPDWHRVMDVLDSKRRITAVSTAPAVRVAIGEEFGMDPGTISTGRLVNALRALGFDYVFDTNFTADLTIMEEANELLSRVRGERPDAKLPLFTSCCPGWINYVEINRPDLIPHLSTTKSPQQMHAATTKYSPFAQGLKEEPFVVSVMPCTAKKDEAVRPAVRGDVDAVLTTRELAKLIKHRGINFASLPNDGEYDHPLGESTGAAVIFGASGGVLEAALRTAAYALGIEAPVEWDTARGVDERVKVAKIPGVGSVAAVNSIGAAVDLLSNDDWKKDYLMIEVMSCKGGCLGGGGEPKSDDPEILQKRAKAIYEIDSTSKVRSSHENKEVKKLYDDWLGEPLSHTAEQFLHATYAARGSPREKLMRLLAAVDFRDGMVASHLFSEGGVWNTNHHVYGVLTGREEISKFIKDKMPSIANLEPGERRPRHLMVDHADGTDVVLPGGGKVHFDVVLDDNGLIRYLSQYPIHDISIRTASNKYARE